MDGRYYFICQCIDFNRRYKKCKGENQLEKLTFLGIESLADGEGGGSDYREATPHDCNYSKDVFLEGADHIINVTVPGKKEFVMVLMAHAIAGRVER